MATFVSAPTSFPSARPSTRRLGLLSNRRAPLRRVAVRATVKFEDSHVKKDSPDDTPVYFESADTTFQPRLKSLPQLAFRNFIVELDELVSSLRRLVGLEPSAHFSPPDVLRLRLSNEAVANREREREFNRTEAPASGFVRGVYVVTCQFLDVFFADRPIQRFWFLETVARMPYFAYTSCLHLYATLGWYRSPTMMNMHHAEELNEAYHLAVMESLGGDKSWIDRFFAFHASIAYYWFLVFLFIFSPVESYRFSELIETHAVDTYSEFLESNKKILEQLPVPDVAREYYENFLYYFYEFQLGTNVAGEIRPRPTLTSLYDVFVNILRDETEHSRTMSACISLIDQGTSFSFNGKEVTASLRRNRGVVPLERKKYWEEWSSEVERDETS